MTSFQLLFVPPEILATLRGHSGLVKGLTWDPVGKYIASQADDRSLKVWRTLDWQLETSITKPFDEVRACSPLSPRTHTASDAGQSCGVRAVPFSGAVKCPPLQWRDLCGSALKRLQHAAPRWGWRPRLFLRVHANLHPGGRQPLRDLSCPSIQSCDRSGPRTVLPFSFKFCVHAGSGLGVAVAWETLPQRLLCTHSSSAPPVCTHASSAPPVCTHTSSAPPVCTHASSAPPVCTHASSAPPGIRTPPQHLGVRTPPQHLLGVRTPVSSRPGAEVSPHCTRALPCGPSSMPTQPGS